MAKLHEEVLVIKVSKLLRDSEEAPDILNSDVVNSIDAVLAELTGAGTLVEIETA